MSERLGTYCHPESQEALPAAIESCGKAGSETPSEIPHRLFMEINAKSIYYKCSSINYTVFSNTNETLFTPPLLEDSHGRKPLFPHALLSALYRFWISEDRGL
jgi:hypothetical protein